MKELIIFAVGGLIGFATMALMKSSGFDSGMEYQAELQERKCEECKEVNE